MSSSAPTQLLAILIGGLTGAALFLAIVALYGLPPGRPGSGPSRLDRLREHRHQRLRPCLHRLRRRQRGPGRAGRGERRGADRAHPGAGRLLRPVQPSVRHRQPAAGPAAAGRVPAVRGDGRDAAARDLHPARPDGQGLPRRPHRQRHDHHRDRPVPARRRRRAQEHHDRRGDQRGEDDAAAGAGQPDPGRGTADHGGARARARPRPLPRAASERGGVRGTAAEQRGPGRDHHGGPGPPEPADEPEPGHRRRGPGRRDRHHAERDDPGQRRLAVDRPTRSRPRNG